MSMDPYLIGSCHGLLCFLSFKRTGKIHYVYNSLTKEWKSSPPIESSGKRFCGLYHKMSTNTYHLLTHVLRENHLSSGIRILDGQYKVHELGTSAWRVVSEENNPYVPLQRKQSTPVAISSCLYWICLSNKEHESRMILAFDVEMEKFSYIKEPTGVNLPHNDSKALTLLETDFGLGYPTFTEDTMNIWVMRGQDRAWEKFYAIKT
ncbi:F-box protein interaction domain protein [Rhynchospora pubera]|uniref:F-box protein interaction domain protein n=1 Tax=Rhynchospora pubera TaxID=906938 RepID=A0AAV8HSY8_9POAL|nr:F-box protein interaction domain protein [Rhynchospora pubera]